MTSPLHCTLQALVNQVAATIYARFHRKKLPAGKAVYGVFTRDYQYNTLNSQVIVVMLIILQVFYIPVTIIFLHHPMYYLRQSG